jgi:serine phosphatase RsbU (regulator of sigma subunit)
MLYAMSAVRNKADAKPELPWRSAPRRTIITFLLAVFFVFAAVGFVTDSVDMGRQPHLRFAIAVLLNGLFAVGYASSGVILRRRFWIVFFPLFLTQIGIMSLISRAMPDASHLTQYNTEQASALEQRISFDGSAVIVCVMLGYVGFVTVSISEARRYALLQSEKASLESEMTAAQEIQRLMVPEDLPPTPGYRMESVYHPAAQVGGDFFQVIPVKSGRTLVVLGDVSGKGLSAAMIVSMVVGMLRTITGFTEEPAEILGELNRRLCGRTQGGFATCLVARLELGGMLAISSAGHLPPYVNCEEVPVAGSLPLGMAEDAVYEQTAVELNPGDRIFLLTDGIVEAQDSSGRLFGFSRVEWLLREGVTAGALADAAQQHGQADDITAICIETQEVGMPAASVA